MTAPAAAPRLEHDLLGDRLVPAHAYFGVHTLRATENFAISGAPISSHPDLIVALACVKQAAALANRDLGLLSAEKATVIVTACEEIRAGRLHEDFVVDVVQGGAGTSTNMNANEVIANRALELLDHARGEYTHLHPLEDVNMGQSTNDVYPTAVKIGLHLRDPQAARRDGVTRGGVLRQGGRLRRRHQDGPHPAPGRRPHDPRPGIRHLRGHEPEKTESASWKRRL